MIKARVAPHHVSFAFIVAVLSTGQWAHWIIIGKEHKILLIAALLQIVICLYIDSRAYSPSGRFLGDVIPGWRAAREYVDGYVSHNAGWVDAAGTVLWMAGLARSMGVSIISGDHGTFLSTIAEADGWVLIVWGFLRSLDYDCS